MVPRLQVGVEFNAVVEEVNPLVTLFLLTEADHRPAMFLGTSSDRIGSPALLDYYHGEYGVSLMYIWLEQFGISLHGGF